MSQPKACRARRHSCLREEFTEQIAASMEDAGVAPARIYAFRKTGFMPCVETIDLYSDRDWAEYQAAIAEFEARQLAGAAGGAA